MAQTRFYSSTAQQTTLTGAITPSTTTITVAATDGFPGSVPYTLALDFGSSSNELVDVTGVAGLSLTVTRGVDGTTASSHNIGAVVRHVASARDFTEANAHIGDTVAHGATGAVVGTTNTQTLTNKTVTNLLGSARNFTLFNTGATGITQIIGDSANTGVNRLEIKDNELAGNIMSVFRGNGALFIYKQTADTDSTYRLRVTDNDQSTDRFSVLAGGTATLRPTSTTTSPGFALELQDLDTTKKAIRISTTGTDHLTVWNDGRVDVVGTSTSNRTFDITAPASMATDIFTVRSSADATLVAVQSNGKLLANVGATVAQPGVTSGTVLQVGGTNAGYTGNLQTWVNPSNAIVAQVSETGKFTIAGGVEITSGVGEVLWAYKTADTARTTQTGDDPHLLVTVEANAVYEVEAFLSYLTTDETNADIEVDWTVPAGGAGRYIAIGQPSGATGTDGTVRTPTTAIDASRNYGAILSGSGGPIGLIMRGTLVTAGSAGTYAVSWNRTGASGTITLQQYSSLKLVRRA